MKKHRCFWPLGLILLFLLSAYRADAQGTISVSPMDIDFGNVVVGVPQDATIVAKNVDTADFLQIDSINLTANGDYVILEAPPTPAFLFPNDSVIVRVRFKPTRTGRLTSSIRFDSTDFLTPTLEVVLDGYGILALPPTIGDLIAFFDQALIDGTIEGKGAWHWIRNLREWFFRSTLVAAQYRFDNGQMNIACAKLYRAYLRSDGQPAPFDWIQGSEVATLNSMIQEVRDELGCNTPTARVSAESLAEVNIQAYPNPFTDRLQVVFMTEETQEANLEVVDFQGRRVEQLFSGKAEAGQKYAFEFNGAAHPAGMYLLVFSTDTYVSTKRVVLSK
jgi:hypothetical protein